MDGTGMPKQRNPQDAQTVKQLNGIKHLLYVIVRDVELIGNLGNPTLKSALVVSPEIGIRT